MRQLAALTTALTVLAAAPAAAQCGGGFPEFVDGLRAEAVERGHDARQVQSFFGAVRQDQAVLKADRSQGIFQSGFVAFSRKLISQDRIERGRAMAAKYNAVFDRIESEYGIARGVLLAFWAFETDYGTYQGDFNTLNALVTLAHDCRRPELFRPQVFSALELFERGDFDPARTTGAWAGEIGMVQMLPEDILTNGVDGDGDGRVTLKTSAPDALLSGARMLSGLGWRAGEPWLQEVELPGDLDLYLTGLETVKSGAEWAGLGVRARSGTLTETLDASILLPEGKDGPAFIAYPNFRVYFEWNQSFTYVLTAAYFANRLAGGQIYDAGAPEPGLTAAQMQELQRKLAARGYDVGKIDGILGAGTRAAVRDVQRELGLPADAWPTAALLQQL
ncbi:lytic murein transglycosylase [Puniceibacterium confluentis]|uniref:lytic murein transglycosylase n=3 Tax=Puniceibacterium confluentis TaxID=1958944 RepID=UPI0011B79BBA|nr:lytic murein transglycosylase [Puniceibacterium confluentis]